VPTHHSIEADHHVFIVPGVVDGDVVREQANAKQTKLGESSYVHDHKHDEDCTDHRHWVYGDVNVPAPTVSHKV
jgi:hypothetical protein